MPKSEGFRPRSRSLIIRLCFVFAGLLLLGGCGGDDDNAKVTATAPRAQSSSTGAATEPTETESSEETPEGHDVGGDTGSSGDTTDVDACSLIKTAEAALALGTDVSDGKNQDLPPFAQCEWTSTSSFDFLQVAVLHADKQTVEAHYDATQGAEEITGLGDKAQWGGLGNILEVIDGNYDLTITIVSSTSTDDTDLKFTASGLAERALGRLP